MSAKLIISREKDASWHLEREFGQDLITIGRDNSNILLLEDPRKVISRQHAKLKFKNGRYYLIDCGSRNYTFLNSQKVSKEMPMVLKDGDWIKIGDYQMQYFNVEISTDKEITKLYINPFVDDLKKLSLLLKRLNKHYEDLEVRERDEKLDEAFKESLPQLEVGKIEEILAQKLNGEKNMNPAFQTTAWNGTPAGAEALARSGNILDGVLQVLLDMMHPIKGFHRKFIRSDRNGNGGFLADTPMTSMSFDELKDFLLSENISESEAQKRIELFKMEMEHLSGLHGRLLDTFQHNLHETIRQMLKIVDPIKVKKCYAELDVRVGPFKVPYRLIPFYINRKVSQYLKKKVIDLLNKESFYFEQQVFQTPFISYMGKSFEKNGLKKKRVMNAFGDE